MSTTSIYSTPGQDRVRPDLFQVIERVRQRWRLRRLLNGLFYTLALMATLFVVLAWMLNYWHFSSTAVWATRLVTFFSLTGLLYQFCLKPLSQSVSDAQVALYLQEHEPALKSIIVSAVDAARSAAEHTSPQLTAQLLEQAVDASAAVDYGQRIEEHKLRQAASKLALALVVIAGLIFTAPEFLRNSVAALLMPWTSADEYSPY
ncbi:MAG: hypothetical protein HKN34_07825, partial [Gammaproteobacteria bacterium]|nr:hypothetical protein [Gammaproteobacteria bacterium]